MMSADHSGIGKGEIMGFAELLLIAAGLSMDAFAVSICKGLSIKKMKWSSSVIIGLYFGGFQALMPLIGYFLGVQFQSRITKFDHWIAFILLSAIGLNMIKESREECKEENDSIGIKVMVVLALATSIDALAIGVTFAFLKVRIVSAVLTIGITTFLFSIAGVKIGNVFGSRYRSKAELAGGILLIAMGAKILLEHLGILAF